jgi:hypothetical protein
VELGYAVVLEMSGFVHDGAAEQDDVGTVWRFRRDRQDGPQPRGDRPDGREQPGMGDRRAG